MLTNFNQAMRNLKIYVDLHLGNHFNSLLQYVENIKQHETNDEISNMKDKLGKLPSFLASDFHVTKIEIDQLIVALKNGVDQFHNQLIKVLLENYQSSNFFKIIEEEISEISNDLQHSPYNYHSANFENVLKAGIMILLHKELNEERYSDDWAKLAAQFDPSYIKDSTGSIHDQYLEDIIVMRDYLFEKYKDEPNFPIFILNLVHTFPYESLGK